MVLATRLKQIQSIVQEDKPLYKKRALQLIDSKRRRDRMMGYALLTTCFHYCSLETQNYIRGKWKEENNLNKIKKNFIDHCAKIFLEHY